GDRTPDVAGHAAQQAYGLLVGAVESGRHWIQGRHGDPGARSAGQVVVPTITRPTGHVVVAADEPGPPGGWLWDVRRPVSPEWCAAGRRHRQSAADPSGGTGGQYPGPDVPVSGELPSSDDRDAHLARIRLVCERRAQYE